MSTDNIKPTKAGKSNVTPITPAMRDVTRIPAEIAKRAHAIMQTMGREAFFGAFEDSTHPALELALAGKTPATWQAWKDWQIVEQHCRRVANNGHLYARPKTQRANGKCLPAPMTAREYESKIGTFKDDTLAMPKRTKVKKKAESILKPVEHGGNVVTLIPRPRPRRAGGGNGGGGPRAA